MRKKVLIVDDEPEAVALLKKGLEAGRFDVVSAGDGVAGREAARTQCPSLILLDVVMPGQDGFAVLASLRKDEATRRIPVIMLTAQRESKAILKAQGLGVLDYLMKPVSGPDVLKAVESYVGQSPG